MNYKLNKTYIRNYAEEVSDKICNEFFKDHQVIEGKQLVNLTQIRQINLFLVKSMYLLWQEEGGALHSPYFNYTAPEVRQAFNKLMNVLSKNISISRTDFEGFLAEVIKDSLNFLISPPDYFEKLFESFNGKIHVKSQLMPLKKYYRYHFPLIEKYFDALLEEGSKVKTKKALKVLYKCINKYPALLSNTSEVIHEYDVYGKFDLDKTFISVDEESVEEPSLDESDFDLDNKSQTDASSNAFSTQSTTEEESGDGFEFEDFSNEKETFAKVEPIKSEPEVKQEESKPLFTPEQEEEKLPENNITPKETVEETGFVSKPDVEEETESAFDDFLDKDGIEEEAPGITKASVPDETPSEQKVQSKTLLEQLQEKKQPAEIKPETQEPSFKKPLFKDDEPEEEDEKETNGGYSNLVNKVNQGQVGSTKPLRGNIPLNMKLRYKKELFGDDQNEFDTAIDKIDQCKDYHEAIGMLKENYVRKYSWDFSGEATREFLSMVDGKF